MQLAHSTATTCCLLLAMLAILAASAAPPPGLRSRTSSSPKRKRPHIGKTYSKRPANLSSGGGGGGGGGPRNLTADLACGVSIYSSLYAGESDSEKPRELRKLPSAVIGGEDAQPGEFPWLVKLVKNGGHVNCGGSIMDAHHILTAAHCIHNCSSQETIEPSNIKVHAGAHERNNEHDHGQVYEVERVFVHQDYCSSRYRADIGMLRLSEPLSFGLTEDGYGSVNTICMPCAQTDYEDGEPMMLAGWGRTNYEPRRYADNVQKIRVPHVEDGRCEQSFLAQGDAGESLNFEPELELCAGGRENEGSCKGDSGGPLMRQVGGSEAYELAGVVSRGLPCATKDSPSVYMQVDAHLDWIAENAAAED